MSATKEIETIELTDAEFEALPEYSCSIPTGVIIGKRWKRGEPFATPTRWYVGEYAPHPTDPKRANIIWRRIAVKMPLLWEGD